MVAMAKDRRPSDADSALWRRVTDGVKPLTKREKPATAPSPPPSSSSARAKAKPKAKAAAKPAAATASAQPEDDIDAPRAAVGPELAHGDAPGVDRRTADSLRRGRMKIEARLDLHGMTQAEAHRALTAFVEGQQGAGRRCVLVVTGKGTWREGGGVLRDAVPRWLNMPALRPKILSFSYAQKKDGGDGALYILLRRMR